MCNIVVGGILLNGLSSFRFARTLGAIQLFRFRFPFFPRGNIETCYDLQRYQILD